MEPRNTVRQSTATRPPGPEPYHPKRQGDRRILDRRGRSAAELEIAAACARAGATYVGLQLGVPELGLKTLILFQDPHDSTLSVSADQFSEEAVTQKLIESEKKWRQFAPWPEEAA